MAWIDIVFIGIIVVFAIIGLVKGLFDSILSLVASVASIFLAFWASKPVAAFLNKIADVNEFFANFLVDKIGIPETGVEGQTLEELAAICTLVLSVIIVFVLIKIAVWLLAKLFDSVTAQSTAASGINRLLGLAFGAVKGFAIVLIALGVTSIASMVPAFDTNINNFLADSGMTRGTYNYVDEWVEEELEDRLKDFVKDLAEYVELPEEEGKNYAKLVYEGFDEATCVAIEGQTATITLPESIAYESTEEGEQNITVVITWASTAQVKLGTEVKDPKNVVDGVITLADLQAGEYTVTLSSVLFKTSDGSCEHTAEVVFTFTIPATTPQD